MITAVSSCRDQQSRKKTAVWINWLIGYTVYIHMTCIKLHLETIWHFTVTSDSYAIFGREGEGGATIVYHVVESKATLTG